MMVSRSVAVISAAVAKEAAETLEKTRFTCCLQCKLRNAVQLKRRSALPTLTTLSAEHHHKRCPKHAETCAESGVIFCRSPLDFGPTDLAGSSGVGGCFLGSITRIVRIKMQGSSAHAVVISRRELRRAQKNAQRVGSLNSDSDLRDPRPPIFPLHSSI
jgi:hypothetical protein